jgi:hypothetical protein
MATGFHLRDYTNLELFHRFRGWGFEPVTIYMSFRGHPFRMPGRPLLAFERWLLRPPPRRARVLLRRSVLHKLIDNCHLVAVKASRALGRRCPHKLNSRCQISRLRRDHNSFS